jgi:AcrR family transcriptional regulator
MGTGTTTLYRYIDTKDELFDLLIDSVFGERVPPSPTGDWQADLRAIAREYRAIVLRHPWLAMLPMTRQPLGPNSLAWLDAAYGTVDVLNLDADEVMAQVGTLLTFVRGHVLEELTEQETARRSGVDRAAWLTAQAKHGETIIGSGNYPHLSRVMIEAEAPHAEDRFERAFDRGLDHILTGLAHSRPDH